MYIYIPSRNDCFHWQRGMMIVRSRRVFVKRENTTTDGMGCSVWFVLFPLAYGTHITPPRERITRMAGVGYDVT